MKPVSYPSLPSSVMNGGHPSLDHLSGSSSLMRCEKCGFASTDSAVFKNHMIEHMGKRFFCLYCNHVTFSEAEYGAHLKQHSLSSKYPFSCPHCGQGYMRRLCLVKHIERLHAKAVSYGSAKPSDTAKILHAPISSSSPSLPTAAPSPPRPLVRVSVPTSSASALRLVKDDQRGKTLDTRVSNISNGNVELLSPLNGLIQHNRALTVSLPEEVSIPAGCLVELVEVKTVNGTKELKLRLVSQQENGSVIKDARTSVPQHLAPVKQLSPTLNNPNIAKPRSMGMCTVSRKQFETRTVNLERPAAVPINLSKNVPIHISKDKNILKRASPEIINLECHTVVPKKIPKIINLVREGNSGIRVTQREPVNHNAAPHAVTTNTTVTRVVTKLPSTLHPETNGAFVNHRAIEERRNSIPEHSKSIPRRVCDIKSIPHNASVAVKREPGQIHLQNNPASSRAPIPTAGKVRTPPISLCKDNIARSSFSLPRTLNDPSSFKTTMLSNHTNSKTSSWNQGVVAGEGNRPESFPVISSVFSLSQQTEDAQGSIQPLVMALRGIVMDKSNNFASPTRDQIKIINNTEQLKEMPTSGVCPKPAPKDVSVTHDLSSTVRICESVKVEENNRRIQKPPAPIQSHPLVKEETNITSPKDNNKCGRVPDLKILKDEESVTKTTKDKEVSATAEQMSKRENDSSKFLTVSLKRVQVGVWKKNKKGLKLRISKYKTHVPLGGLTDCTVIYPMPLKKDQLVKRPGPNQPVVVLNHPKPRTPMHGARVDSLADARASEGVPKCQILKMRLSKVMGQKYEVMGCTVGVSP